MSHFKKIAEHLSEKNLDAMLVTSEANEFYAMGFHGEGVAFITEKETWYFTDSRYIEAANQMIIGAEIRMISPGDTYQNLIQDLVGKCGKIRVGFEDRSMSVSEYKGWSKIQNAEFIPASKLMSKLRMIKDSSELQAMKKAQKITDEAFDEILTWIKPGQTECEVAAKLTYIMASKGAEQNSFKPIVACGSNGSKPHAVPTADIIQEGQFLTMDFGCIVDGYCSDMTRTIAIGQPDDEMRNVYEIVLKAQEAGIAAAKGGVKGNYIHNVASQVITDAGYGEFFGHGFGHSLGIEIHEEPRFSPIWDKEIPSGVIISAEPGIYLPGRFGVRIEDVIILTDNGSVDITGSPKKLIVL